jgi:hypothetical protein
VGFILGTAAMLLFLVGVLLVVGHFYPGLRRQGPFGAA